MILNVIFGFLAGLSCVLLLWQWLAARRFPLHQRSAEHRLGAFRSTSNEPNRSSALQPAVTLLKPVKGCDAHTEKCLRSWFAQEYAGPVQILFGVHSAADTAIPVIHQLIAKFPTCAAQLVLTTGELGTNGKVSNLAQLVGHARHDVLVISDADVLVPPDFLAEAVAPLTNRERRRPVGESPDPQTTHPPAGRQRSQEIGLVNCFYRLANPTTLAMQWEAIAINADFWSQVLQSKSLKPLDFALGAVMVTRRKNLAEIGGFEALADCLADDYQLGHRIAQQGHRIELCPVVVECWHAPQTWAAVWAHQLRWARTVRVCQPAPYFFSILSNPIWWPLLWLLLAPGKCSLLFFALALSVRMFVALNLQQQLTQSWTHLAFYWLAPIKDLMQVVIWLCAFAGHTIEWRGQRFQLRKDGTLVKLNA